MPDREKVMESIIDAFDIMIDRLDGCSFFDKEKAVKQKNDAIELLKEQKAVKPIITPWAEDEDGNIVIAKKECGKCGCQFFTERPNFCENCGTPILWEGR